MKTSFSIFCLLTLCLFGCAAQSSHLQISPPPGRPVLRVGVAADAPPLIFKQAGEYAGIEAELAAGLAGQLGMGLEFVECPWDDLIPQLIEGRFDIIMSGMTITRERSVRLDFTESYLKTGQLCLVRNETRNAYPTIASLQFTTARVGAEKSTTSEHLIQQYLSKAKKESFSNSEKGAQALIGKKIDVFIGDGPVVWWLAALYESKGLTVLPLSLTDDYLAWGVRKNDIKLKAAADQFVRTWKQNGRLKQVLQRWMPNAFNAGSPNP